MDVRKRKATTALVIASGFVLLREKVKKEKNRSCWSKPWLSPTKGAYNMILNELRLVDKEDFRKYLRMNTETFEELLSIVEVGITKQTTRLRKPI